jgi:hypothetical protein
MARYLATALAFSSWNCLTSRTLVRLQTHILLLPAIKPLLLDADPANHVVYRHGELGLLQHRDDLFH